MAATTSASPGPGRVSYALTPLQQGMLAQHLRAPGSGVDIEQLVCTLPEHANADALRDAWAAVVERHDVLRTSLEWNGLDQPRQTVFASVKLPFAQIDWRAVSASEREARF